MITAEFIKIRGDPRIFERQGIEKYQILYKTKLYKCSHKCNEASLKKFGFKLEIGMPDTFYIKDEKIYFIEFKSYADGLRKKQLWWILKHDWIDVHVVYVYSNPQKPKKDKTYSSEQLLKAETVLKEMLGEDWDKPLENYVEVQNDRA